METFLFGLLFVGGSVLLSVLGLRLVRRVVPDSFLATHHEVAGFIFGVLGVIYAVLLAFVVIVVWEEFEDGRHTAEREATILFDVYWMAHGFSDPVRLRAQDQVRTYARLVIEDEWPLLAQGTASQEAEAAIEELRRLYWQMEPQTTRENAVYAESLSRLSDLSDSRQERLLASRNGLPTIMWVVLLVGGMITVAFTYFFGLKSMGSQSLMTAALAGTIALVLFLITAINYPYQGDIAVHPEGFQNVLERMGAATNPAGALDGP